MSASQETSEQTSRRWCEGLLRALRPRYKLAVATAWSVDPLHNSLFLLAIDGASPTELEHQALDARTGLSLFALESRQISRYQLPGPIEGRYFAQRSLARHYNLKEMVCLPIIDTSNPHQVLLVVNLFPEVPDTLFNGVSTFPYADADMNKLADEIAVSYKSHLQQRCNRVSRRLGIEVARFRRRFPDELERWFQVVAALLKTALGTDAVVLYAESDDAAEPVEKASVGLLPKDPAVSGLIARLAKESWATNREQLVALVPSADPTAPAPAQSDSPDVHYGGAFIPLRDLDGKPRGAIGCIMSQDQLDEGQCRFLTYDDIAVVEGVSLAFGPLLEILVSDERRTISLNKLAHELRVPVVAFRAAAESVKTECQRRGYLFQFDHFADLEIYADVMRRLLLELDSVRKGPRRLVLEPGPVWLHKTIAAAVGFVKPLAARKGFDVRHIKYDNLKAIPDLNLDDALITTVIFNLLDNAIKYHNGPPDEFTVEISRRPSAEAYEIEMRDHGVGVPEGYEKRIFERGIRGPTAHLLDVAGEGLGLWFGREIVRCHGGDLRLTKRAKPTTFLLVLPDWLEDDNPTEDSYYEETP